MTMLKIPSEGRLLMTETAYIPRLVCTDCGSRLTPALPTDWRCMSCSGLLEIANPQPFVPAAIDQGEWSLWRYSAMLPAKKRFTLGEGMTPLVRIDLENQRFLAKLDYLNPTGSYKDRGMAVMVNHLAAWQTERVVEDSSGNAGSSLAAYASAARLKAKVFVPAGANPNKKRQIGMSADVIEITGPRANVTEAVIAEAESGRAVYASHAWSPFFIAGMMTLAWELWEQTHRKGPDAVVVPVGMGGLLLGLARGFRLLKDAGVIDRVPWLFAVQSSACDPVVRAWERGSDTPSAVVPQITVADGISIALPVRGWQIMRAIRETGGAALRIEESLILPARDALARRGLFVEPTSATVYAALKQVREYTGADANIVLVMTGHGLKSSV
jgi:threonine synthase